MKKTVILSAVVACSFLIMGSAPTDAYGNNTFLTMAALGFIMILVIISMRITARNRRRMMRRPQPEMLRRSNRPDRAYARTSTERNERRLREEDYNEATAVMSAGEMASIERLGGFVIRRNYDAENTRPALRLHGGRDK